MGQMGSIKKEEEKFSCPVIENKDGDRPFLQSCVQSLLAYTLLFHFVFTANL